MNLKFYTWDEFDNDIERLSLQLHNKYAGASIYGIKRGGLIPAVALSHQLEGKVVDSPKEADLVTDDIIDTGKTYIKYSKYKIPYITLFTKKPIASRTKINFIFSVRLAEEDDWIVFPWENKRKVVEDYEEFKRRRKDFLKIESELK